LKKNGLIFLYNIFINLYGAALHLAALWNPKAKLWVNGRKGWKEKLTHWQQSTHYLSLPAGDSGASEISAQHPPIIWMHCASLGEFEQGRPLLEAVKIKYPAHKILLTFFSPSGYEIRKNYGGADRVMYLPMDGRANAKQFISLVKPSLVLWVKYEYWHYYLKELKNRGIPVLLISGIFRSSQPFFKWYGGFWKKILTAFAQLFVQTSHSKVLLGGIGFKGQVCVTGDTRFDRVIAIAAQWESPHPGIDQFCKGHQVLVAGSTWEEDEELLIHYARAYPAVRFIIAPHDVNPERITDLQKEFPQGILYSSMLNKIATGDSNVLIIDNIGVLSRLYKYGAITYVGGGFNQSGIHNILEAAVYGKPVLFGPVYEKFAEARILAEAGGAYPVENALELEALLNELLNDPEKLENGSRIAREFVYSSAGATKKIMEYIQLNRLLTS
jgi:3-deoxy-D-manno-octulosonic-acid transferase